MCLQAEFVSLREAFIWHCLFGHLNHIGLRTLTFKNMVIYLPIMKSPKDMCTIFQTGKQHRELMSMRSLRKASKQFQLLHSNICSPIKPALHTDKRYILSFINDYIRKTSIYFLHEKSHGFIIFKNLYLVWRMRYVHS